MSGHSKWANIQHRKGRQDAKRSNLWTKVIREIIVAARLGGGDPDMNPRLRLSLLKARAANVPKDTVKNASLKGTVADVRHILSKNGGNLGTDGSVSFMFKHCGYFLFAPGLKEDDVMEVALDNGADDVVTDEDGSIEVTCDPAAFEALHKAFTDKGWEPEVAEVTWKSDSETVLTGDEADRRQRLIDGLADHDDVSEVYTTAVFE